MQPPVKIQKEGNHINVYFSYNEDLVDIMRDNKGWWIKKKKCWMFPAYKKSHIISVLENNKYRVKVLPDIDNSNSTRNHNSDSTNYDPKESFKDSNVISVWGRCKKCGRMGFINRHGICTKCNLGL